MWLLAFTVFASIQYSLMQNATASTGFTSSSNAINGTVTSPGVRTNTTPVTTTALPAPTFQLYNENTSPCLKVQMRLQFQIYYEATTAKQKSINVELSTDPRVSGFCGNNTAQLVLSWQQFTLWMTFTQHHDHSPLEAAEESLNVPMLGEPYWEATFVRLSYNVKENDVVFDKILHDGIHSVVSKDGMSLFATPVLQTYKCSEPQNVNLTSSTDSSDNVIMTVSDAKMRPFSVDSTVDWGTLFECDLDRQKEEEKLKSRSLVPIVVAGSFAGIIVLVVIAYIISKRTNKIPYRAIE